MSDVIRTMLHRRTHGLRHPIALVGKGTVEVPLSC